MIQGIGGREIDGGFDRMDTYGEGVGLENYVGAEDRVDNYYYRRNQVSPEARSVASTDTKQLNTLGLV